MNEPQTDAADELARIRTLILADMQTTNRAVASGTLSQNSLIWERGWLAATKWVLGLIDGRLS